MSNFDRSDFYPFHKKISFNSFLKNYSDLILNSKNIDSFEIEDISSLDYVRNNSVLFINKDNLPINSSKKKIQIITNSNELFAKIDKNITLVKDLNFIYNYFANQLFIHDDQTTFVENCIESKNNTHISKFSKISQNVIIGKNCYIGRGVKIGPNSIIKNNVVIKNAIIGENNIIGDNTTIGSTGFGFDYMNRGANNINPHLGIVITGKNVRIGSNCCIDRGKLDFTFIDDNCMLDNLIHIAHNVKISKNACIAAQTGISGSVTIGYNVTIGGQVGFAGHISIGNNVTIAAKSGVTKNIADNVTIAGFPAEDIKIWRKKIINERKNRHK